MLIYNRLSGRKQWQYDGLYLTNWDWQAWGYAKRGSASGELGLIASVLITAARKIKFKGLSLLPHFNEDLHPALHLKDAIRHSEKVKNVTQFGNHRYLMRV